MKLSSWRVRLSKLIARRRFSGSPVEGLPGIGAWEVYDEAFKLAIKAFEGEIARHRICKHSGN